MYEIGFVERFKDEHGFLQHVQAEEMVVVEGKTTSIEGFPKLLINYTRSFAYVVLVAESDEIKAFVNEFGIIVRACK